MKVLKNQNLALALVSMVVSLSFAEANAQPKTHSFLGLRLEAPPAMGTAQSDQDFMELHRYQDHRTPSECESADSQSHLTLENGFGPQTGVLTEAEMKKAKLLSVRVMAKASLAALYFKKLFKRPRPYKTDSSLNPCVDLPGGYAYPSGHSTNGYALALALAKKFPYKKDLILKQGLKIGENRLIGGVHHPSDVVAGRKLAQQVVKCMLITRAKP